jgi:hypothetical protein
MIDKHSRIIVCGDYEGDLKAIVDGLNSLRWSFGFWDDEQPSWAVKESLNRQIIVVTGNVPCPSLRPMGHFLVLKNGRRCLAGYADNSFMEQWQYNGDYKWDECTLPELSHLISPHLAKGTLEFVAAHASEEYVSHERLLVRPHWYAEWHNCASSNCFGLERWTRRETEQYPFD